VTLPVTNKFLIVSHKHGLLPFAWKLMREGMDVEVVVWKDRYEKAWQGLIDKALLGDTKRQREGTATPFDEWIRLATEGELIVLTDSRSVARMFEGAPRLFARLWGDEWTFAGLPSLLIGAWYDGESFRLPHWIVPDWGVWPGGLGSLQIGGATLISQDPFMGPVEMLEKRKDGLSEQSFKGLLLAGLGFNQVSKQFEDLGVTAGWPFLGTHIFLSQLPMSFSYLLMGDEHSSLTKASKTYTVGLPISIPPWPNESNVSPKPLELEGLTTELMRDIYFHDIATEGKSVRVAGLDGLVGVATTSANSPGLARAKAVQVATSLGLIEKQFRSDVGFQVDGMVAALEQLGFF